MNVQIAFTFPCCPGLGKSALGKKLNELKFLTIPYGYYEQDFREIFRDIWKNDIEGSDEYYK